MFGFRIRLSTGWSAEIGTHGIHRYYRHCRDEMDDTGREVHLIRRAALGYGEDQRSGSYVWGTSILGSPFVVVVATAGFSISRLS